MDLGKLPPAPWSPEHRFPRSEEEMHYCALDANGQTVCDTSSSNAGYWRYDRDEHGTTYHNETGDTVMAFVALARNFFDVAMRRGWGMERLENGRWVLCDHSRQGWLYLDGKNWFADDPYQAAAALVDADRWLTEQEAKS